MLWDWDRCGRLHCLVPEVVQLVFNKKLHAISSMSEVRSEHRVCFRVSLRLVIGERWHVTCHMWLKTCQTRFFFITKVPENYDLSHTCTDETGLKSAKKLFKKNHSIGVTILTCEESRCLPYAGYFYFLQKKPECFTESKINRWKEN